MLTDHIDKFLGMFLVGEKQFKSLGLYVNLNSLYQMGKIKLKVGLLSRTVYWSTTHSILHWKGQIMVYDHMVSGNYKVASIKVSKELA